MGPYHPENIKGMDGWRSQHRGIWWVTPDKYRVLIRDVPNYLNDLNAIHAAIATLPFDHQITVAELLTGDLVEVMQATAAQLSEAFIKTINKWTDD